MKKGDSYEGLNLKDFDDQMLKYIEEIASNETSRKMTAREKIVAMGEEILEDVKKLLSAKNRVIRWEAAKILQQIKSETSIPDLILLLEDDESDIRWIAAEGLIHIGRTSISPLLEEVIDNSDSQFLRSSAHHVLMRLFTREEKKKYKSLLRALNKTSIAAEIAAFEAKKTLKNLNQKN